MFFAAFVEDLYVTFDESIHAVNDLDIFTLEISQEEGQFSKAIIEIENPGTSYLLSLGKKNIIISEAQNGFVTPIFRGSLVSVPSRISGQYATLEFIGKGNQTDEAINALASQLRAGDFYDNLYVDDDNNDPEIAIEASPLEYFVDRKTLNVSFSHILTGSKYIDIQDNFLEDSFDMEIGELPVSQLKQVVEVEFEQRAVGKTNIAGQIKNRFVQKFGTDNFGRIETLTPEDFEANFPTEGIGQNTGWSLVESDFSLFDVTDEFLRSVDGVEQVYNEEFFNFEAKNYSDSININIYKYNLQRLMMRYDYRQPRKERLLLTVNSNFQPVVGDVERTETLADLLLNDILEDKVTPDWNEQVNYFVGDVIRHNGRNYKCLIDHVSKTFFELIRIQANFVILTLWQVEELDNSALRDARRSSYFTTDRGHKSIKHGLERLKTQLLERSRFITITFETEYDLLKDIDTDTTIRLTSDKIPNGAAIGKVINYSINAINGVKFVRCSIGVSIGTGQTLAQFDAGIPLYTSLTYDNAIYQESENQEYLTSSGIVYDIEVDRIRQPVNPWLLSSPAYSIEAVDVSGTKGEQRDVAFFAAQNGSTAEEVQENIKMALVDFPTRIEFKMRRIAPSELFTATINSVSEPIFIPRGINLDGAEEV